MSKRGRATALEARITVVDSGSLEFVVDYKQTKDFPIGKAVYSDAISTSGLDWKIECCPRGRGSKQPDNGEYLSMYLILKSKSATARAIFRVSVLGRHGKPAYLKEWPLVQVFTNSKDNITNCWGWHRFAKRRDLEAKHLTEGRVTFLCHILVMHDNPIPLPPPSKGNHLRKLLDEMDGKDVSFTTNGQTFHAHRAVLAARSPFFKTMFFASGADATSSNICLDDIEPAAFQVLLKFIYTDALPGDDGLGCPPPLEMFHHLFAAADKYGLHRLKLICANKLWENVSLDSVASTLDFAEIYNCLELKNKCIDFLVMDENFNKVVLTEGFVHLRQKFPSLVSELRERIK